MNCRLCSQKVLPGLNSLIEGDFAIHTNCQPGRKSNPKDKKRPVQNKKNKKKNPFIAAPYVRGWRDV